MPRLGPRLFGATSQCVSALDKPACGARKLLIRAEPAAWAFLMYGLAVHVLLMCSDAKAKKAAQAKKAKGSQRHNQGGNKATYARPTSRGAKGKAVTGRGK